MSIIKANNKIAKYLAENVNIELEQVIRTSSYIIKFTDHWNRGCWVQVAKHGHAVFQAKLIKCEFGGTYEHLESLRTI